MLVSICVSTFRRPEGLRRLLEGLGQLVFRRSEAPEVEVVVVDNEAVGRAASICREFEPRFPFRLHCHDEPQRGITYARNRGLDEASPATEFIALIDDDESPDPGWLEALLVAQARYDADIVTGPVAPLFEAPETPRWVILGGFFAPRSHADGQPLGVAFTNNVLLRASIPRQMDRQFDHRFALSGGEDTDFFMRAHRAGFRIVWAADAVVRETIPPTRTTLGWILRRGYREWGSHSLTEKTLYPGVRVRMERILKAGGLVVAGLISLPMTLLLGRHRLTWSLLLVSRGLGTLSGLTERQYLEYAGQA